ncbi:DNA-directed RNA polymerase subunit beta [Lactiplantibacillus carotarum]|uniref:DNA-directed RNA polymerase subunit beta n=1 Tax=Lactiplantibacillus carotarum TaxID=2993456 RepID=UPI00298EFF2C|nr:DNA-directed RNA polymerase subunit beta [Lactiplantibacillus carotarum]
MERIVPREKWLYDDRGMMKWMGWLLSDHSAYMETAARTAQRDPVAPQLDVATINQRLQVAWQTVNVVAIQPNTVVDQQYVAVIHGIIVGFNAGQLFVQAADGQLQTVTITQIRSVVLVAAEKWWTQDEHAL